MTLKENSDLNPAESLRARLLAVLLTVAPSSAALATDNIQNWTSGKINDLTSQEFEGVASQPQNYEWPEMAVTYDLSGRQFYTGDLLIDMATHVAGNHKEVPQFDYLEPSRYQFHLKPQPGPCSKIKYVNKHSMYENFSNNLTKCVGYAVKPSIPKPVKKAGQAIAKFAGLQKIATGQDFMFTFGKEF